MTADAITDPVAREIKQYLLWEALLFSALVLGLATKMAAYFDDNAYTVLFGLAAFASLSAARATKQPGLHRTFWERVGVTGFDTT